EQPRQAPRPGRHRRQVADQLVAQAETLAHAPRRADLDLHARHVDAGRAVTLAALATHAQIHRLRDLLGGHRHTAELARQGEPQGVGAAARQVDLVARDAEARAHRAGVELPAMAVVVAHFGGPHEAAGRIAAAAGFGELLGARIVLDIPGRPVERRLVVDALVARLEAEQRAVVHLRRPHDLAGVQ